MFTTCIIITDSLYYYQSFNSDAITWGALGNHLYAPGGRYGVRFHVYLYDLVYLRIFLQIVPFAILIGLAVPVPFWLIHKKFPTIHADKVVTPILCCECRLIDVLVSLLLTLNIHF